jgi:hypothetical protein
MGSGFVGSHLYLAQQFPTHPTLPQSSTSTFPIDLIPLHTLQMKSYELESVSACPVDELTTRIKYANDILKQFLERRA